MIIDDIVRAVLREDDSALSTGEEQLLRELEDSAMVLPFGAYTVPVANAPWRYAKELCNRLAAGYPFAVVYWDDDVGRHVILRSVDGGVDVAPLAREYGGGGHRDAAGFVITDPGNPFAGAIGTGTGKRAG